MIRTVARFAAVTATSVTMLALLPAAASANVTFHAGASSTPTRPNCRKRAPS